MLMKPGYLLKKRYEVIYNLHSFVISFTSSRNKFPSFLQCKKKGDPNMRLNRNDCTVEAVTGGGFYAYFMNNILCSAYGETPDEACENLEQIVDDFVSYMYMVEEFV